MNKYFVIYDWYSEYNQFEGSWDTHYKSFSSIEQCIEFMNTIGKQNHIQNIIGPLKLITTIPKNLKRKIPR